VAFTPGQLAVASSKNEVHAVLMRRLVGRCPFSDLFGKAGREWLRGLELPVEECETIAACMRHIEFLDAEIAEVERVVARQALLSPDAKYPLTVPGVNVICAATFLAAIGDIRRFKTSRELVGYLGLDPKVRQLILGLVKQGRRPGSRAGRPGSRRNRHQSPR
jgi:transposase